MSTNPTLDLDRLEAEHFLCPDCDRFAKHMPHCNECADSFPCRVLTLIAKARRLERLEAALRQIAFNPKYDAVHIAQRALWTHPR